MRSILEQAVAQGQLRQIDLHAGLFLQSLAGGNQPENLDAALASVPDWVRTHLAQANSDVS